MKPSNKYWTRFLQLDVIDKVLLVLILPVVVPLIIGSLIGILIMRAFSAAVDIIDQ